MRGVSLLLLLTACGLDREKFEAQYLDAFCDFQATCDPPLFSTQERCLESESEDLEAYATCALREDGARICLQRLRGATCMGSAANFPGACLADNVYDCES
jgi:hypothetical protein